MDKLLNSSSWGRKGLSDNEPRRKQIESLFAELPTIRAVPGDDSRFQMTLNLSNSSDSASPSPQLSRTIPSPAVSSIAEGNTAIMTIYLPPAFPEEEPKITISPCVRHLWVDGTVHPAAVTGHERLMPGGWSSHANLGRIVKEISNTIQWTGVLIGDSNGASSRVGHGSDNIKVIYEEYSKKPPPPIPGPRSKSLGQTNTTMTNSASSSSASTSQGGAFGGLSKQANSTPGSFTGQSTEARIVMEMSADQLDELLDSQIAFQHFIDHLEVVVNSRTLKNEWWLGNDNVSRRNLALEAELLELQKSTAEGHKEAIRLQKIVEEKLQQQQDALWRFKPETLQSKLRSAVAESDELSESVAHTFLEGNLDQDSFIRQFQDLRKVYHLREMKNERLASVLRSSFPGGGGGVNERGGPGVGSSNNPENTSSSNGEPAHGESWVVI